jgi:hypothetical protein
MSRLTNALRATTCAALMGSFACLGTATATADSNSDTLFGSLSKGYTQSNCNTTDPLSGSLATVLCGQSPDSSGPAKALYALYSSSTDLSGAFTANLKDETLSPCGDNQQNPTVWHQGNSTASAGQVACGIYQGNAEVIWTTDAKNVLSYVRAGNGDVPSLYKWWQSNG